MVSSLRMLSSLDMITPSNCDTDFFFDPAVKSCQPCKDFCSGPETQEGLCEELCKEYMERNAKTQQDNFVKNVTITVSVVSLVLLIAILIICLTCYRVLKLKKQNRNVPTDVRQVDLCRHHMLACQSERVDELQLDVSPLKASLRLVGKSTPAVVIPKLARPPKVPSKQSSFVSSEYAFVEDDRNSPNEHSELGSSLHSSVIESPCYYPGSGETKPFFQDLTDLLSGLNFVKSICTTDTGVHIAIPKEEFAINEMCVRERLRVLQPKHEGNLQRVDIVMI